MNGMWINSQFLGVFFFHFFVQNGNGNDNLGFFLKGKL